MVASENNGSGSDNSGSDSDNESDSDLEVSSDIDEIESINRIYVSENNKLRGQVLNSHMFHKFRSIINVSQFTRDNLRTLFKNASIIKQNLKKYLTIFLN